VLLYCLGQKASFGADSPERQDGYARPLRRLTNDLENDEPGVAVVEEAEAIASRLDVQPRPGATVDNHGVAEKVGIPDRRTSVASSKQTREFG
jgi:hypothetical protein